MKTKLLVFFFFAQSSAGMTAVSWFYIFPSGHGHTLQVRASLYFSYFGSLLIVLVLFTSEKQIFVFLKPCLKLFTKDKSMYIARHYTHYFSRLFLN